MYDIQIKKAVEEFLENERLTRSENTEKTYRNAMNAFMEMLEENGIASTDMISVLKEDHIAKFARYLKLYSPATESLYINVAKNFYEFLIAENWMDFNIYQTKLLIRNRTRKPGIRLPQFPKEEIIKVLEYAEKLPSLPCETERDRLVNLRDGAFLITLADTGLRVHEACALRAGNVNWYDKRAEVIGKGNKQAVVRFSDRSVTAIRNYMNERAVIDGSTGRMLATLPIFSRHDKGAGKEILPISTKTGRDIVNTRVRECLGDAAVGTITPHSFRHYFVTNVLNKTGNLKIAQEFARHSTVNVTQRYAHLTDRELDDTYNDIFN